MELSKNLLTKNDTELNEKDLKELFNMSGKQARALMRTKGFPSFEANGEYRVEESELLTWIATQIQV